MVVRSSVEDPPVNRSRRWNSLFLGSSCLSTDLAHPTHHHCRPGSREPPSTRMYQFYSTIYYGLFLLFATLSIVSMYFTMKTFTEIENYFLTSAIIFIHISTIVFTSVCEMILIAIISLLNATFLHITDEDQFIAPVVEVNDLKDLISMATRGKWFCLDPYHFRARNESTTVGSRLQSAPWSDIDGQTTTWTHPRTLSRVVDHPSSTRCDRLHLVHGYYHHGFQRDVSEFLLTFQRFRLCSDHRMSKLV